MRSGRLALFLLLLVACSVQHQITFFDDIIFEDESIKAEPEKASFFLARFAQAEFEPKCHDKPDPIIVPVYFHAGGTIELPCKMCEWAFVVSGEPKAWKYIPLHHVGEFLKNPTKFILDHKSKKESGHVQSLMESLKVKGGGYHRRAHLIRRLYQDGASGDGNTVPPAQKIASIHNFVQADGKLYIHGTMMESSGVYFCYDDNSLNAHTRVFFLVQAMAPLVFHSKATGMKDITSVWNVDKWLTSGNTVREAKCENDFLFPFPDEFAHMRYTPAEYLKADGKARNFVGTLPRPIFIDIGGKTDTNLLIDHENGEWTPCTPNTPFQYREVHCVLKRVPGKQVPVEQFASHQYSKWAYALNSYFDKLETLRLHSYYLTSLMYKGNNWVDGTAITEGYDNCDQRAKNVWTAFEEIILPSLFNITAAELKALIAKLNFEEAGVNLPNGLDESCYEMVLNPKTDYSVDWWSIRGVSFIQKQKCPK